MLSTLRAPSIRIARANTRAATSAIAHKYAGAAFGAALKKSPATLDTVQKELSSIGAAVKTDEKLAAFVNDPTLSNRDRQAGLQALFARAGGAKRGEVSEVTKNLFNVLAENRRLTETVAVVESFSERVAKHRGELEVIVTSAKPLDKDVLARLEKTLKQSQKAQQAKTVKITNKVCASLLLFLVVDLRGR
jgi:F-type H+-transporting ATPase subunit O